MDIITLVSASGALGGIFGALGSGFGRLISIYEMGERRKDRALEIAHEKERWAHENERLSLREQTRAVDTNNPVKLAAQVLDRPAMEGGWSCLKGSIDADDMRSGYIWVQAARALVRPVLTVLIWLIFTLLFCVVLASKLPSATAGTVALTFVNTVNFGASTALAWWFGDRTPGRSPK